jgi:hypothetical protein
MSVNLSDKRERKPNPSGMTPSLMAEAQAKEISVSVKVTARLDDNPSLNDKPEPNGVTPSLMASRERPAWRRQQCSY